MGCRCISCTARNASSSVSVPGSFGNSYRPASNPFFGRLFKTTRSPSRITSTVRSSILLPFAFFFTGSSCQSPRFLVSQKEYQGHWSHKGSPFGTQTMAPSSISAWLKLPAQSCGITCCSACSTLVFTDCFIISELSADTRIRIRNTFPSTAGTGIPYAMDAIAPAV